MRAPGPLRASAHANAAPPSLARSCPTNQRVDEILTDESGSACGVSVNGERIEADSVVAAPEHALERVERQYEIVRLYAVLSHAPNMCKEASTHERMLINFICT